MSILGVLTFSLFICMVIYILSMAFAIILGCYIKIQEYFKVPEANACHVINVVTEVDRDTNTEEIIQTDIIEIQRNREEITQMNIIEVH